MATNLIDASITTPGATTTRTFGDRFAEVVNVKDFGAVGDGTTDDRPAIQAALDYAYGTTASPHAEANKLLNRPVYFPAGSYRVASNLTMRSVRSPHLFGDGKYISMIRGDAGAMVTNGCAHGVFERLGFTASGGATAFHLDWDGTGSVSLNANSFYDVGFDGGVIGNGCEIGATGIMGSENLFTNCDFSNTVYGLRTLNANALDQTIIGGSMFNCSGAAIIPQLGSILIVADVGFAGNAYDIMWGQPQNMVVTGCRTESTHFAKNCVGETTFIGTEHLGGASSHFIEGNAGTTTCIACKSDNGDITGAGWLFLLGNVFNNAAYLDTFTGIPNIDGTPGVKTTLAITSITWGFDPIPMRYAGQHITNTGATGTLSTSFNNTVGHTIMLTIVAAQYFTFNDGSGDTVFRAGALVSAGANGTKYIRSNVPGSSITLVRFTSSLVVATSMTGTWEVST